MVDACSFLELNHRYPLNVFPKLWSELEKNISNGVVRTSEEIIIEICRKDDQVATFVKANPLLKVKTDEEVQRKVIELLKDHPEMIDLHKGKSGGDPFLVACAALNNATVVSEEVPVFEQNREKKKVPDACKLINIPCIKFVKMLSEIPIVLN